MPAVRNANWAWGQGQATKSVEQRQLATNAARAVSVVDTRVALLVSVAHAVAAVRTQLTRGAALTIGRWLGGVLATVVALLEARLQDAVSTVSGAFAAWRAANPLRYRIHRWSRGLVALLTRLRLDDRVAATRSK